ncbi:hypothetical protein AQPW35_37330 [Rubrivivax pictus]|uniref:Uncharacterized protein n=1 Tax=Pseudaquabacterium pictum TaxID=2315236 RepID=A0A480AWT6_9BURK|nr:hypothetical protein AQPW35_37330 [Rubrivivax pictus]
MMGLSSTMKQDRGGGRAGRGWSGTRMGSQGAHGQRGGGGWRRGSSTDYGHHRAAPEGGAWLQLLWALSYRAGRRRRTELTAARQNRRRLRA